MHMWTGTSTSPLSSRKGTSGLSGIEKRGCNDDGKNDESYAKPSSRKMSSAHGVSGVIEKAGARNPRIGAVVRGPVMSSARRMSSRKPSAPSDGAGTWS